MSKLSLYKIPLRSLSEGKHQFDYRLEKDFFKMIDDEDSSLDVKKGHLDVSILLKKIAGTFELNFTLTGSVSVPCDRCLDDIEMEVNVKNRLFVKFGKEYSEESDEIVVIPEEDGEINVAWFLYEFVLLSLPMKRVHPSGECNKAMTSKLKKHKTTTSNDESDDNDEEDFSDGDDSDNGGFTDSRWDGLKNIDLEQE